MSPQSRSHEVRDTVNPEIETLQLRVRLPSVPFSATRVESMLIHRVVMLFIPISRIMYDYDANIQNIANLERSLDGRLDGPEANHRDKRVYGPGTSTFVTN